MLYYILHKTIVAHSFIEEHDCLLLPSVWVIIHAIQLMKERAIIFNLAVVLFITVQSVLR